MYSERAEREAEAAALFAAEAEAAALLANGLSDVSSNGAEAGSTEPTAASGSHHRPLSRSLSAMLQKMNAASGFDEGMGEIFPFFSQMATTCFLQV
jgi:hypothetical protein